MDKTYSTLRKKRLSRNQQNIQNEVDAEESRSRTPKMPLRDKCCQTDHHHHGCCEPEHQVEPGDPPLLQKPVQTSKSGIQQIIECFRSGTKQLKHILLKEVDTIFECRSCRSLFRGLPNLITHKQFYCLPSVNMDGSQPDENNKQSQAIKDLLEAIYPKVDKQEYVINVERIETNPNAVFQYVTNINNTYKNIERSRSPEQTELQMQEPSTEQLQLTLPPNTEIVEPLPVEHIKKSTFATTAGAEHSNVMKSILETSKTPGTLNHFTCHLCTKEFNTRRGIRRHVRRVHKKKLLEMEMKKCVEMKRKKNLSSTKGTRKLVYTPPTTTCHVCHKCFATKANARRHVDEVHKGLRRDSITPEIAESPEKPIPVEAVSPKKSVKTLTVKTKSSKDSYRLGTCKCPHCKRKYSSQVLLKKHLQIVHKTTLSGIDSQRPKRRYNTVRNCEVKLEVLESLKSLESSPITIVPSPQNELKGTNHLNDKIDTPPSQKCKVKQESESSKSSGPSAAGGEQKYRKPKLSAGFDFKQLYCKVCKRQFTSKQNLNKHIDMHTDGNTIFVKFYRCPICTYDTRRKRDVIRHITVVHKRSSRSLLKITSNLESRAIKKPIEFVLNKVTKRGPHSSEATEVVTKQDSSPVSPCKKFEGSDVGIEVKVTKNFTLLRCNKCGKAFAKKTDLVQHKKAHKTSSSISPDEVKGRSTRSKTFVS